MSYNLCNLSNFKKEVFFRSNPKIKHKAHFFLSTTEHLERLGYMWFLHFLLIV